jgi:hypothetical protein
VTKKRKKKKSAITLIQNADFHLPMNLLKILCVVIWPWAYLFLTSEVMEAVRGQKWHEGVDLLKKVFNKSFSRISKTP